MKVPMSMEIKIYDILDGISLNFDITSRLGHFEIYRFFSKVECMASCEPWKFKANPTITLEESMFSIFEYGWVR